MKSFIPFLLSILFVAHYSLSGQTRQPDSLYFKKVKTITEIAGVSTMRDIKEPEERKRRFNNATDLYLELAKSYRVTCGDVKSFIATSIQAERGDGLFEGVTRMVMLMGESAKEIMKTESQFTAQIYKQPIVDIQKNPSLAATYKRLVLIDDSLLSEARKKLDWQAIIMLKGNFQSDIEYRGFLPNSIFKDSTQFSLRGPQYRAGGGEPMGKVIGMGIIDSIHFATLYSYIKERGFPGESSTGCYCTMIWFTMRHSLGLLAKDDPVLKQQYVEMWKYLIPVLYENALKGEYPYGWYQYVHQDLVKSAFIDNADKEYFRKFTMDY